MVSITLSGSFGSARRKEFSALNGGHAQAVAEAINYLAEVELPKAIKNDHECHRDGIEPSQGFGKLGTGIVKPVAEEILEITKLKLTEAEVENLQIDEFNIED